jgi:ribose 5-phosphate isomerase A
MSVEREKQAAAEVAADLVEDGMTVGLGTGSTVAFLLPPWRSGRSTFCVPRLGRIPNTKRASWACGWRPSRASTGST